MKNIHSFTHLPIANDTSHMTAYCNKTLYCQHTEVYQCSLYKRLLKKTVSHLTLIIYVLTIPLCQR